MTALTRAQAQCLNAIIEISRTGWSPSIRELQAHLGLRSTSRVADLLDGLEQRGAIRRTPGRKRAIEVIPHTGLEAWPTDRLQALREHITEILNRRGIP